MEQWKELAEQVIKALSSAEEKEKETHDFLCELGDAHNANLKSGADIETVLKSKERFKAYRQEWLVAQSCANFYRAAQQLLAMLNESEGKENG